jgi:hypothetical protein
MDESSIIHRNRAPSYDDSQWLSNWKDYTSLVDLSHHAAIDGAGIMLSNIGRERLKACKGVALGMSGMSRWVDDWYKTFPRPDLAWRAAKGISHIHARYGIELAEDKFECAYESNTYGGIEFNCKTGKLIYPEDKRERALRECTELLESNQVSLRDIQAAAGNALFITKVLEPAEALWRVSTKPHISSKQDANKEMCPLVPVASNYQRERESRWNFSGECSHQRLLPEQHCQEKSGASMQERTS